MHACLSSCVELKIQCNWLLVHSDQKTVQLNKPHAQGHACRGVRVQQGVWADPHLHHGEWVMIHLDDDNYSDGDYMMYDHRSSGGGDDYAPWDGDVDDNGEDGVLTR